MDTDPHTQGLATVGSVACCADRFALLAPSRKIDEAKKMGIGQAPVRLGTAMYVIVDGVYLGRKQHRSSSVKSFCPTSPEAIWTGKCPYQRDLFRQLPPGPYSQPASS